jgi:biotin carboxyl carrier protein
MQNKDSKDGVVYQTLIVDDTEYKTLLTDKYLTHKPWVKPDEKKMLSALPGTILKIQIKKGDTVKAGQLLMQYEAMKMINTVLSPVNGTIKDIFVNIGDKIGKNAPIIEIE